MCGFPGYAGKPAILGRKCCGSLALSPWHIVPSQTPGKLPSLPAVEAGVNFEIGLPIGRPAKRERFASRYWIRRFIGWASFVCKGKYPKDATTFPSFKKMRARFDKPESLRDIPKIFDPGHLPTTPGPGQRIPTELTYPQGRTTASDLSGQPPPNRPQIKSPP